MLNNITKKQLIIISVILIIIISLYYIYNKFNVENKEVSIENILIENKIDNKNDEKDFLVVHITGAVNNPGIVKLDLESRIEDAIISAGGLTEDADITNVNLAYVLEDGMKITIPSMLDVEEDIITENSGENIIIESNKEYSSSKISININKATTDEFAKLPGIGNSLAARIVKYREENGKFKKIEDIKNVSGIGENKFEQIKDLISVK